MLPRVAMRSGRVSKKGWPYPGMRRPLRSKKMLFVYYGLLYFNCLTVALKFEKILRINEYRLLKLPFDIVSHLFEIEPLEAEVFIDWTKATGNRFARGFAAAMGISEPTAQGYYRAAKAGQEVPLSRMAALAMTAVALGLEPWGKKGGESVDQN